MGTPEGAGHLGEPVGTVRSVRGERVIMASSVDLHPGDGLAFVDGSDVAGTAVNGAEGRHVLVQDPSRIRPGTRLHRNHDHRWLKTMRTAKVDRRMAVRAALDFPPGAVRLRLEDEAGIVGEARASGDFAPARDREAARKAVHGALDRLGGTPFILAELEVREARFVPASCLNALRREAATSLETLRRAPRARERGRPPAHELPPLATSELDFTWNVANRVAQGFYERAGAKTVEPAAELLPDLKGRVVMTAYHCLRYELGWCPTIPNPQPWKRLPEPAGPLFLKNGPTRLECRFDCVRCRMQLVAR